MYKSQIPLLPKEECIKKTFWAQKIHKRFTVDIQILGINFSNLHLWDCQPNTTRISWCYYSIITKFNILEWISNWHILGNLFYLVIMVAINLLLSTNPQIMVWIEVRTLNHHKSHGTLYTSNFHKYFINSPWLVWRL